ncbi:MAG: hypothetical protein QXY63_03990, partial [Candidatus Bilamarchaeaceae archaeon]
AFEWIKNNREKIKSKDKGEELSLPYIALILEVAGKLEKINAHGLQIKCAAYDFFRAKEHYFINTLKNFIKNNSSANIDDFCKWCKQLREYESCTLFYKLNKNKPISLSYLKLILRVAKSDLEEAMLKLRENKTYSYSDEDINNIKKHYAAAVKKIQKTQMNEKEKYRLIKKRRREVKLILNILKLKGKAEKKVLITLKR